MKTCERCGQPMSDTAEGLCPRCLMSAAANVTEASTPAPREPAVGMGAPHLPDIGDPAEVAKRLPQFEIMEMLGRGGMGVVYKARQLQLDRLVALKILPPVDALSPDFVERFRREARSLAKLSHPNIVGVHDFGESGGLYFFAMEFVDGVNLREMIRTGRMKPEEALAVVPKICDALQFAHEEGVVHRDVKPENILIDKRGRVKIADFGLAKLLRRDQTDHTLTMSGMTLGTPRYMAPEQLEKPDTVDHRADIYSLGVVFYEMLTGEVPMGRFDPPSKKVQVDVKLDEIVLHALERDVERRYQHASEIKTDVESVSAAIPMPAKPSDAGGGLASPVATAENPRLSRAALCGAIWAFFGVLAVLPAVFYTTLNSPAGPVSGPPPSPPIAFNILMGTLLIIGAGAPIGTTILGGVALGHIKRSRGTLYGLPLAFADVIFFPMVLLHGAMAVLLGLLLVTLIKMAGVNTGLGSAEMGLVAMLPLIADFFIVRALWRKVAGRPEPRVAKPSPEPGRTRHFLSSCLVLLFFAAFIFAINFRATYSMSPAGPTSSVTVGTFDPLFVRESNPAGFHQSLQVISWSFFALVVAGVSFGALWRIGREDEGKVARDSMWWRGWWKQVGFWCGLLLIGCVVRTVLNPEAVFKYTTPKSATVRFAEDPSRIPATRTAGRTDYAYTFTAPANHRLYVWIEWWKDGKRTIDQDCNTAYVARRGDRLERSLHVVFNDGNIAGPATKGQVRIDWLFDNGKGNSTSGRWRPDFFEGLATSVDLDRLKSWKPKVGETVNLLEIRGGKESIDGNPVTEERLRAGRWEAVMILRARVEAVPESRMWEGTITKMNAWNDNEEPSPALLRLGEQFGAVTGPFATAANHREQIAYNIRKDPAVRAKAEQSLREKGVAFSADEKPEELVRKLEGVAGTIEQSFMIGTDGPELTTEAKTKLKLSNLQVSEINRTLRSYHHEYLALHRRHSKVGTDDKGRIAVTVEPFYDECLALANRLQTELGGIVDGARLPVVKDGAMPFQVFQWGGAPNQTVTMWKADGKYHVEEKLTGTARHPRDPYTFNMSGPKLEEIPEQFRIYWREE